MLTILIADHVVDGVVAPLLLGVGVEADPEPKLVLKESMWFDKLHMEYVTTWLV